MTISSELRERVLRQAAANRPPTRAEVRRSTWLGLAAAASISTAIFAVAGGARPGGRPAALMLATSILAAAIAATASWIALRRGASMLGRSRESLVAVLGVAPLALFAGRLALSARWPGMTDAWPERQGIRCLALSLALAAPPLFAYLWMWRRRDVPWPRLHGATLGVAAGALAWTLVDAWCPVSHPGHLALGHLLPLALLAAAGVVATGVRAGSRPRGTRPPRTAFRRPHRSRGAL